MFEEITSFATMGTMNSFLQQKKLRISANYKVKTGQRLSDAMSAPSSRDLVESMMKSQKKTEGDASKQRVALIRQKLVSGNRISQTEMEYLRERDTALYRKAKKVEEYREELKARLKTCKTKQEARMAVSRALVKAAAETSAELSSAKTGTGGGGATANDMGGAVSEAGGAQASGIGMVSASATEQVAMAEGAAGSAAGEMGTATAETGATGDASAQATAADGKAASSGEAAQTASERRAEECGVTADGKASKLPSFDGKNSVENPAKADGSSDSILEKFIMVIRALEDEWKNFSNSEEYKKLPDNLREEEEEKKNGKKPRMQVREPSPQLQRMIHAYRAPMIYRQEFALEDILQSH